MKVTNLTSPENGGKVANQYSVEVNGVDYFQSYDTVVARYKPFHLEVSEDYKYSSTTNKYFGQWLAQWGYKKEEIDRLRKMLKYSEVGNEFTLALDNGSETVVYYAEKGAFKLS